MEHVTYEFRGAHACGVLAMFSRTSRTFAIESGSCGAQTKVRFGRMPQPARRRRALPGIRCHAFTIIELLIVMAIIIVLAGLVVATTGYVQEKGKRSRTEAEIAAMSAALESYKADNGIYPTDAASETLDPRASGDPSSYWESSLVIYKALSGREENGAPIPNAKTYFNFKPQMIGGERDTSGNVPTVEYVRDAFGNSYGYSTMKATAANPATAGGYNPTFDLWSTGGTVTSGTPDPAKWIKNW